MESLVAERPNDGLRLSLWGDAKSKAKILADFYKITAGEVVSRALGLGWLCCIEEGKMRILIWKKTGEPLDIIPSKGDAGIPDGLFSKNETPIYINTSEVARDAAYYLADYWQVPPDDALAKFIKVMHEIHAREPQEDYPEFQDANGGNPQRIFPELGGKSCDGPAQG